ncbi:metallophosphoesterase [Jeotgalibacillus haloalkalitolerans]|uniref:Phosphoesterase n=1 Tax=Jeotgalibacillus haloalkalitolerans TaxID=3104292 RepID=A0ABU5KN72_9BACL|nr:metallophosphoesterase [Jeotgalibacillus sp. HH7-29]MDZ5712391.1 metallophosphoesterase [Jeotgalibacillus sp. HH7-29]
MKLLVVSDNHGDEQIIKDVRKHWENKVDYMFHAGDSELPFDSGAMEPFVKVRGNCDFDSSYPENEVVDCGDIKVFITHGHLYGIKSSLDRIRYKADENNADLIIFGHSHQLGAEMLDRKLFLNPGSTRLPRDRNEPTYAVVSIENLQVEIVFYTNEHDKLLSWNGSFND